MPEAQIEMADELTEFLRESLIAAGDRLRTDIEAVRAYTAGRMAHLATCVGQPGYREAVEAEAHAIVAMAATRAIDQADATDARIIGIVQGALTVAARVIV